MANAWYGKALELAAGAGLNFGVGTGGAAIHVDLVDTNDFTNSLTTFQFRSSIPAIARIATFGPLIGKTLALGVLDANDYTFSTVIGDQAEALIYWINTGSDATSPLLVFVDSATSGLPVTPNSGNIAVTINPVGIATL